MGKNLIKLIMICLVLAGSISASAYFINERVLAMKEKENTIAGAILQSQMQKELSKAEEQAKKELEENEIIVETESLTMKPPKEVTVPRTDEKGTKGSKEEEKTEETNEGTLEEISEQQEQTETEETMEEEATETEEAVPEIIEFDLARGTGKNPSGLLPEPEGETVPKSLLALSKEEQEFVGNFLIEHYFLDGYVYATRETDGYRKERKQLAADMEQYVIDSLYSFQEILPELLSFGDSSVDLTEKIEENKKMEKEFETAFRDAAARGEEFGILYDEIRTYFSKTDEFLTLADGIFKEARESPNPLLSAAVLLTKIQSELVPAVSEIIELGIGFKPWSNAIYLEGVDGVVLLSKEETAQVIKNPGLILNISGGE